MIQAESRPPFPLPTFVQPNCIVQSSLDYALGKKHNGVVNKAGAIAPLEPRVLEMADHLIQFSAEGSPRTLR